MAKKKGSGRTRNPGLIGGKNTLPKKENGVVDIKKVVKQGAQEQKKKWVDKKVVKGPDKTKSQAKIKPMVKPKQKPKFKPVSMAKKPAKPNIQLPAHKRIARPITSRQTQNLQKSRQAVVKAPKNTSPNPSKNQNVGISKLRSVALKNQPVKATTPSKGNPSKGASMLRQNISKIASQPKPVKKVKAPVIRRGR